MKLKTGIIAFVFLSFLIPFILINDFYPFFRFGMFAEPVKESRQNEQFKIYLIDLTSKKQAFLSETIGFDKGHFNYIIRAYYYRNKAEQLLRQVYEMIKNKQKIKQLKLIRIETELRTQKSDTTELAQVKINE